MRSPGPIDNSEDLIDSRDVIARIEDLRGRIETAQESGEDIDEDERTELAALERLAADAAPYAADWDHGEMLIRDSYFKTYAQDLADDIGAIPRDAQWPMTCIDWDAAARDLQMDYTSVEFDGVTYWLR